VFDQNGTGAENSTGDRAEQVVSVFSAGFTPAYNFCDSSDCGASWSVTRVDRFETSH
jgi:hypothetical protein